MTRWTKAGNRGAMPGAGRVLAAVFGDGLPRMCAVLGGERFRPLGHVSADPFRRERFGKQGTNHAARQVVAAEPSGPHRGSPPGRNSQAGDPFWPRSPPPFLRGPHFPLRKPARRSETAGAERAPARPGFARLRESRLLWRLRRRCIPVRGTPLPNEGRLSGRVAEWL